ncbi:TonB-dependent receptor family protein [Ferrovibrio sp.]|jgi:iron complex outermembrane receptor protein|uniref:TonB-dependent receptor family protein n=1 Tax=Ferrovibrio sp. TaxID=1917215 RepID=UPI0035B442F4
MHYSDPAFFALRRKAEKLLPKVALALLGTSAALALLTPSAHSQTVTRPITVTGKAETDSITVPDAGEARRRIENTAGGVDIVPADEVRDGRANTVKDVLDFVPGVFAQPKYGQEDSRLSIRGSGLSRSFHLRGTRILRDGVPITDADGAGDTMEIDPLAVDYTEIYKGANALQYGASLLGGAVNFVSPTGRSQPGFLLRQELGSFDSLRSQFGAGGAQGNFDYYVTPTYSHSSGYRDHTDQDYTRLNGNVGYRFGDGAETRFYLSAANINQKIPNSVTKSQALASPSWTSPQSFSGNTKRNIEAIRAASKTTFLTDSGEATVGFFAASKTLFHPLSSPGFSTVVDNEEVNGGGFARWTGDTQVAGHRNEMTLGLNYFTGNNHAKSFTNVGGARGSLTADADQTSDTLEVYGENAFYVVPDVALIAGLQGTMARRELDDNFLSNGNQSFERGYNSVNPKFGTRWDFAPHMQAFVNYSWSSEPPPFSELGTTATTTALEQQESRTLELGSRGRHGDLAWDAAIYRAWLHNELQTIQPATGQAVQQNVDNTIHQGIELGGDWVFARNLAATDDSTTLRLAYTYSDFFFDGHPTYGNNDIPGAPRHYLRAELRYAHASGWYAGPNVEWVPQGYYVDNANTLKTDPYLLLGAKAGYDFGNGLKLFLDGRNLLDKTFISNASTTTSATASSALFNPGDGRAVFVGAEYRW